MMQNGLVLILTHICLMEIMTTFLEQVKGTQLITLEATGLEAVVFISGFLSTIVVFKQLVIFFPLQPAPPSSQFQPALN